MRKRTKIALNELQYVINADIYLSGSSFGQQEEIYNNTWQISFDKGIASKINKKDLEKFFYELLEKRYQQIDTFYKNIPVTFYMWVDEISMQICFNFLSGQDIKLPFHCKINMINDPIFIFDQFLASIVKGGVINFDEVIFFEKDDPRFDEIDDEAHLQNFVLNVYVITLHRINQ